MQGEDGTPTGPDFDIGFDEIPSGPQFPICSSVARYYVTVRAAVGGAGQLKSVYVVK